MCIHGTQSEKEMLYYWRCKPSANLMQGFSKQETNNFLRSPATCGRELKPLPRSRIDHADVVARHVRA